MSGPNRRLEKIAHAPGWMLALLSALHVSEPDLRQLTRLGDREWTSLLEFCEIAHLTLPLAQLPVNGFPRWVVTRLQTNLADNAQRFGRLKETYREAADALNLAGVEYIVIKGFTQAPDYVASPRLRVQSDIDLYCPAEDIPKARAALQTIGYEPESSADITSSDHVRALVRLGDYQWNGNHFDPGSPLGIELHFCLWNDQVSLISIPEVEAFWERRIQREIDGLWFPCLNPIDHLGYLSLHILRNLFLRDWIVHHVHELAVFLHTHAEDNDFWQTWSVTHSQSLRSLEAIAFYHAHAWFGSRLHPQVEREIADLAPSQLEWLHRFSSSALTNMFRENKDPLWLQLSLLSSSRSRWRILRKTLIPPRVASFHSSKVTIRNKRLVGSSKGHPMLQYLAYFISRSSSHGSASIATLWSGLRWRLAQHRLTPQFWTFLAASFFFDLGFSIYYFLINLFLAGHGYTEKSLGLFTSATAVGNLVGALPWGRLAQRIGLRPVILTCFVLVIFAASTRVLLLSTSAQLVLAFLSGVALSAWAVCLSPTVAHLTGEKQRPFAFSLMFSLGIGLGAAGGLAGGRFPAWFANHNLHVGALLPEQLVLLASCGIVALGIWPVAKLRLSRPNIPPRSRPLISPFLIRYLPAIAVWSLVTGSFSPLATVYLSRHVHLSLPQIGNAFSLSQIVQVGAVLLAPILFRRWGLISGIVFTQVAASALLLALASSAGPITATAAYICFSAFQWMNEPGLYSLLMNMVPSEDRGGASASNSLVMSGSQAIAATLAGGAFVHYGYPSALRGIALLALLAASLFWGLQSRSRQEASPVLNDLPG